MSSHNHGFATHRYLDVMTVRPSQGARVAAKVNATMSPPAMNMMDLPTEQTGRHLSAIDSTKDHIRLQTESSQRLSHRPKLTVRGIASNGESRTSTANHRPEVIGALLLPEKSSSSAVRGLPPMHNSLLVEPVLMPSLHHVHVESPQDLEESCLFYPNGSKNRNIRREIETSVIKHHLIENRRIQSRKQKSRYRIVRPDPYADVKGPPLFYAKSSDPDLENIVSTLRTGEGKILGTVQVRV